MWNRLSCHRRARAQPLPWQLSRAAGRCLLCGRPRLGDLARCTRRLFAQTTDCLVCQARQRNAHTHTQERPSKELPRLCGVSRRFCTRTLLWCYHAAQRRARATDAEALLSRRGGVRAWGGALRRLDALLSSLTLGCNSSVLRGLRQSTSANFPTVRKRVNNVCSATCRHLSSGRPAKTSLFLFPKFFDAEQVSVRLRGSSWRVVLTMVLKMAALCHASSVRSAS